MAPIPEHDQPRFLNFRQSAIQNSNAEPGIELEQFTAGVTLVHIGLLFAGAAWVQISTITVAQLDMLLLAQVAAGLLVARACP